MKAKLMPYRATVRALLAQGFSQRAIAIRFSVGPSSVRRFAEKEGIAQTKPGTEGGRP